MQTRRRDTWTPHGQAPLDMSALKPCRGKPAVRNFRGDDGDVGIVRRPVRHRPTRQPILSESAGADDHVPGALDELPKSAVVALLRKLQNVREDSSAIISGIVWGSPGPR